MSQTALWWIPLVSTIIGGILTLLGGFLTQWLITARQREERARDFQKSTLLELQADLLQIYRGVEKHEQYTQPWRRSTILVVRVSDDQVRNLVDAFKAAVGRGDYDEMGRIFEEVNARIGDTVRVL